MKLKEDLIHWPSTQEEKNKISKDFKFPLTYGAIDGSHISIKAPLEHISDYTNRKCYTSVVLQGVCDSRMVFTHVSAGWPGSMHDARIFRRSSLYDTISNETQGSYHLLGDSAYPLSDSLIVPYKDNGHLTEIQKNFNKQHSSSRTIIERCFALLKGKFRRLKFLDMSKLEFIPTVIVTACILHNHILLYGLNTDDDDLILEPQEDASVEAAQIPTQEHPESSSGKVKRDALAASLIHH